MAAAPGGREQGPAHMRARGGPQGSSPGCSYCKGWILLEGRLGAGCLRETPGPGACSGLCPCCPSQLCLPLPHCPQSRPVAQAAQHGHLPALCASAGGRPLHTSGASAGPPCPHRVSHGPGPAAAASRCRPQPCLPQRWVWSQLGLAPGSQGQAGGGADCCWLWWLPRLGQTGGSAEPLRAGDSGTGTPPCHSWRPGRSGILGPARGSGHPWHSQGLSWAWLWRPGAP